MITQEKISEQIEKSFTKFKFSPRGNQVEICLSVIDAFLNKDKRNVVLGAPTGIGKSIIGAVVSDALDALTPDEPELASIISVGTNILAGQYLESFSQLEKYQVFQIKGASNYPCRYMENQLLATSNTAEECVKSKLHPLEINNYCSGCEYDAAKKVINSTSALITNYSYFLIAAMATEHLKPRKLHVFDEAHLFNDIFCNYTEIVLSVEIIDKYIKELGDTNGKCDDHIAGLTMLKKQLSTDNIGDNNYRNVLEIIQKLYFEIEFVLADQAKSLESVDVIKSSKYSKLSRKYGSLGGKIKDFFVNEYEHVFDNSVADTVSVKTIFVGKMMSKLLTKYNLFMSATITEQFSFDTLCLNRSETEFIEVAPVFPRENKPLFFLGKQTLNYNTMKLPETMNDIKAQIKTIIEFHPKDKGLIFVPSFFLGSQIASSIDHKTRIFEHKSGMKLSELVSSFKNYKGPAVMISPSIFEGLDVPESSFQIIVKAPYPNLSDKRIAYIAKKYPDIYKEMTMIKILQGVGRSVRSPTDTANTFFLDPAIKTLYNSRLNIWKTHYDVKN